MSSVLDGFFGVSDPGFWLFARIEHPVEHLASMLAVHLDLPTV